MPEKTNSPKLTAGEETILNEVELEVVKWFVVDALCTSVREKQIDRDKAADQLVLWFPGDKIALTALYKQIQKEAVSGR